MENSNQTTTVSTQLKFTQADIPSLLDTVNKKIKELSKNDSTVPIITKKLPGFGTIADINDVMRLIQACSSIDGKVEAYKVAAVKHLPENTKVPRLMIEGHSPEEWIQVIELKICEITHKKELDKLKTVKATLEANLSQEMKLANDLAKISELLNEE